MATAIYNNVSGFPFVVNTMDLSGKLPVTVQIPAGEVFMGNTADPLVVAGLANGSIVLYLADVNGVANGTLFAWDETNEFTSFQIGTYGPELLQQMYNAYVNYWQWC